MEKIGFKVTEGEICSATLYLRIAASVFCSNIFIDVTQSHKTHICDIYDIICEYVIYDIYGGWIGGPDRSD